jgi:hypothetical protein
MKVKSLKERRKKKQFKLQKLIENYLIFFVGCLALIFQGFAAPQSNYLLY